VPADAVSARQLEEVDLRHDDLDRPEAALQVHDVAAR
jgi:hypothetical protein